MAWALLKQRRMLTEWGEVMVTVVYLLNWLSTNSLSRLMPYESWHGWKPVVNYKRVFGYWAYTKEVIHVNKLAYQSHAKVFIGYS
jgi:hypothetical protein